MSEKPQSRDEELAALDFIINVLREHEKSLDRLLGKLDTIATSLSKTGQLSSKVNQVEERISDLKREIDRLISYLPKSPHETPQASLVNMNYGPPVILRCKQWEDFQRLAFQAQTLSFIVKEMEKTFQAGALKGNQIITYTGMFPKSAELLKIWLSKQLDISEQKVLESLLIRFHSSRPREATAGES